MKKVYIENLAFITTERCNLDCKHCLRGEKCNRDISDEVIEKTLDEVGIVINVSICGGEPTLKMDRIEKIITYIIDNKINLEEFSLTINGTKYSEELIRLLDYMSKYIKKSCVMELSFDQYHLEEIQRLGLLDEYCENVEKYSKSEHFYQIRELNDKLKLFREGNAERLDKNLTVPLKPLSHVITYSKNRRFDKESGNCYIGPIVCVNTEGIVTDCDASNLHQRTIYNYGNVLDNTIEEALALKMFKIQILIQKLM